MLVQVGMIVLYAAFVPVGLWLVSEAMWQHGAPFRYRVLALIGFGGVVTGVAGKNAIITGAGALCFVIGQLLVTRYVRGGKFQGWTVGGRKPARRSRRGQAAEAAPVAEGYAEGPAQPEYDYGDHDPADYAGYGAYEQPQFPQQPEYAPPYEGGELPQQGEFPQYSPD
ncbi:MAG: hypothetical protein HOV68_23555 [Streptomycetaceae bacterium]|nr:hypothetical protein [Streptomycetaceae bacterium]